MCLDIMLLGVQITAGLGFFRYSSHLVYTEDSEDNDGFPALEKEKESLYVSAWVNSFSG